MAPWSLELPRRETTSDAAEWGRLCHAGAEALARGATIDAMRASDIEFDGFADPKLFAVFAHVATAIGGNRNECKRAFGLAREADAWLVEQGIRYRRSFPNDEVELCNRKPGQEERGWFSGTADLVYVRADGVLVVVDWKFGHLTERIGDAAEEHWQLWLLALAFATHLGIELEGGARVVARVELRHVDEEGCRVDGHDVTAAELAHFAAGCGELEQRIEAGEGPRIGQACGRCSSRHACDAYQGFTRKAIEQVAGSTPSSIYELPETPEEAVALWRQIEAMERALPLMRANVETFARANWPLSLGMGLELRAKAVKGRDDVLDTPEAIAAAAEVLGVPADAFTRPTTSKGAMLRAWAQKSGKGATSADGRAMVKRLRERGVIVEGAPSVRLEVVRQEDEEE